MGNWLWPQNVLWLSVGLLKTIPKQHRWTIPLETIMLNSPAPYVKRHRDVWTWTLWDKKFILIDSCCWFLIDQFHRGRRARRKRWVLGLFDTQYTPARPYLQLVSRRNAATLLPIIQPNVRVGPIVHSDEWAVYRQLQRRLGLHHGTVNHSLHFVNQATGVHTQHAESSWSSANTKFKVMKGNSNRNFLLEYLQEFMWRRWYGDTHPNGCFKRLLQDIAEQYPL